MGFRLSHAHIGLSGRTVKTSVGARVRLAPASTTRVSSKEETQAWRRSLRVRNTTNIMMVEKMDRSGGSIIAFTMIRVLFHCDRPLPRGPWHPIYRAMRSLAYKLS